MKPNFLFIGPDKSGSTWLYEILRHHPQCYVPELKDIYFFDRYYDRGFDWYMSLFDGAPEGARAIGELSHDYLFSAVAAQRIRKHLPEVKLLTCLRDPVDRIFSHYLFMIRSGRTTATFEQALTEYPELENNSLYRQHLTPYFELFPTSQIKILFFSKLEESTRDFAREVFDCLGVPFVDDLPYEKRVLPASRPRIDKLARVAKLGANLARTAGMTALVGRVKGSRLVNRLLYRPYRQEDRPTINPATEAGLRDRLREDVRELQDLLSTDLSHWLSVQKGESS